jgi:Uma2 family endonuclease
MRVICSWCEVEGRPAVIGEKEPLDVLLRAHVNERRLGEVCLSPVNCILSDTTVVQPDLVCLDPTRARLVSERPTLAVEILSFSTTTMDRRRKRRLYADHGIPC